MNITQQLPDSIVLNYPLPKVLRMLLIVLSIGILFACYSVFGNHNTDLQSIALFVGPLLALIVAALGLPLSITITADKASRILSIKNRYIFRIIEKRYTRDDVKEIFFRIAEKYQTSNHVGVLELNDGKQVTLDYPILIDKIFVLFIPLDAFQKAIHDKEEKIRNIATILDIPIGKVRPIMRPSFSMLKGYAYKEPSSNNNGDSSTNAQQ